MYRERVLWLIVGVVLTGVIVVLRLLRGDRDEQMGSVSVRWLMEYRQHHDP